MVIDRLRILHTATDIPVSKEGYKFSPLEHRKLRTILHAQSQPKAKRDIESGIKWQILFSCQHSGKKLSDSCFNVAVFISWSDVSMYFYKTFENQTPRPHFGIYKSR